jgi:DNA-binding NtrC family response regulator
MGLTAMGFDETAFPTPRVPTLETASFAVDIRCRPDMTGDSRLGLTTTKLPAGASLPPPPQSRVALLVYHRDGAELVPLVEGQPLVVGRAPPSDVIVADVSLSRQHARFTLTEGSVAVEDLGSSNGTVLRGARVDHALIHTGDELSLGGLTVVVHATDGGKRVGLLGHDRLCELIEAEITRGRFFARAFAVLMVRAVRGEAGATHYREFHATVQAALRPVDALGIYSSDTLLALLPEIEAEAAVEIGRKLAASGRGQLLTGVASYPDAGTSVGNLLAACRAAVHDANVASPVQLAARATRTLAPTVDAQPIAESAAMRSVLETARRVARGAIPVLLLGETGSGKEVAARFIHDASPRKERPLVSVNCGAIAPSLLESTLFGHEKGSFTGAVQQQKGVFEAAEGGTVFLDEVGELPLAAQAALLRVLEAKRVTRVGATRELAVDVRVLAATNRDLEAMCAEGRFREDLLYRLNTVTLSIPPLRARPEDIAPLALRFLAYASAEGGAQSIDDDALELLRAHNWPGNVRELRNAIERAVVIAPGETIGIDDLPERIRAGSTRSPLASPSLPPPAGLPSGVSVTALEGDFRARMDQLEAAVLTHALEQAGYNQSETARRLGMPLRTLVHKIREHGIKRR